MSSSFLIKPTLDTKFYIDYEWWEEDSPDDLNVYLLTHLSQEEQEKLEHVDNDTIIDYIHPETGEVFQLNALGLAIQKSAKQESFITEHIGLIDSVFRAFLVNDNHPLSSKDLAKITGRDATTILKTIGGMRVYRGIRPYQADKGD